MNYEYDLKPDLEIKLDDVSSFSIGEHNAELYSWLVEVEVTEAKSKLPCIDVYQEQSVIFSQYLEKSASGKKLVNITGITSGTQIGLKSTNCALGNSGRILAFKKPEFNKPILIIAPHPDDAELAAFGFYAKNSKNVWILTVTAGEFSKKLKKQYWPRLDATLEQSMLRKGVVRSWNSKTTPLIAGVKPERNIMLGYPDGKLNDIVKNPEDLIIHKAGKGSFEKFRAFNDKKLQSDLVQEFRGKELINDLVEVINIVEPDTILVTHPEIDPHQDHWASAAACAKALAKSKHKPTSILLYANHLCPGTKGFPWGPAHTAAGLWPKQFVGTGSLYQRIYVEYLPLEQQKNKVVAMDTMHDLRDKIRYRKRLKRLLYRLKTGVSLNKWKDYALHDYFQTHIKCHENFIVVSVDEFIKSIKI